MPKSIKERIKELRVEIAELNAKHRRYLEGPKYGLAADDHQRRIQRLQEILDDSKSLTDWKEL